MSRSQRHVFQALLCIMGLVFYNDLNRMLPDRIIELFQ